MPAYFALTGSGLLAAVLLGRPEPALVVLPFALALAAGLALAETPGIDVQADLSSDRALEGEPVVLTFRVVSDRPVAGLEITPRLPAVMVTTDPRSRVVSLRAGEPRTFTWTLRARRWGVHGLGEASLRSRDRLGLFTAAASAGRRLPLKVYPRAEILRGSLRPLRTQAFAGNFVSRLRGEGIEFADIRPFATGDAERRINWRASARRGQLQVNELHPERNTDLVLFIDSFSELRQPGVSSLDLAVKGAAGLAAHHLARRDRVGLVSFGGTLRWLRPAMGARQLYRLVDALLETEVVLSYAWKGVEVLPARTLPPQAMIVAFTPLLDERTLAALVDLRGRGHDLTIVELSAAPFLVAGPTPAARLAFRIWELERRAIRARYQSLGIPIVEWDPGRPFQAALEEVSGFRRYARLARA